VAERLHVTTDGVRKWLTKGALARTKAGVKTLISDSAAGFSTRVYSEGERGGSFRFRNEEARCSVMLTILRLPEVTTRTGLSRSTIYPHDCPRAAKARRQLHRLVRGRH
jgi:hypothetical protein